MFDHVVIPLVVNGLFNTVVQAGVLVIPFEVGDHVMKLYCNVPSLASATNRPLPYAKPVHVLLVIVPALVQLPGFEFMYALTVPPIATNVLLP